MVEYVSHSLFSPDLSRVGFYTAKGSGFFTDVDVATTFTDGSEEMEVDAFEFMPDHETGWCEVYIPRMDTVSITLALATINKTTPDKIRVSWPGVV